MSRIEKQDNGASLVEPAPSVIEIEAPTSSMLELLRELGATHVKDPNAAAVLKRAVERLLQVDWDRLPKREVDSLLRSNDTDLVLQLAGRMGRNAGFGASQRERLRLEGVRRFRAMIKQTGGTEPIKDVEERLGVSDDTIRKRTKKKQMIAIPVGNRQEYPVWQFDGPQMVPHFEDVLQLLDANHYVDQTRFFITPSKDLDGLSPIDALKKGDQFLKRVKLKARQFQQQGAK